MNSFSKKLLILLSMIGVMTIMASPLLVYADPMDPLNGMQRETVESVEATGEAIEPNAPAETSAGESTTEETKSGAASNAEQWEKEEKESLAVRLMDSVMLFVGVMGVALPTIYMGIYLGARIFPTLFMPLFSFLVRNQFNPEDQPVHIMFLRTIPVAVLGMFMATGKLKVVFKIVWSFVIEHFMT